MDNEIMNEEECEECYEYEEVTPQQDWIGERFPW